MPKLASLILVLVFVVVIGGVAYADGVVGARELVLASLPLVGTYLGAMLAFRLNEKREADQLAKEQKQALDRTLFILMRQRHAMYQLVKFADPYKGELERALGMPATLPPKYDDLHLPLSDLDFLLSSQQPNLLMELAIAQETFEQSLEAWNRRANFYFDEVLPKVAEMGINGKLVTEEEVERTLGEMVFGVAVNSARAAVANVQEAEGVLQKMHDDLRAAAKKVFPHQKFFSYKLGETEKPEDAAPV